MSKQKKTKSLSQKLGEYIKQNDRFGTPVSLTYKGDPRIKSTLGGLLTVIVRITTIGYFVYDLIRVIK
jgi:hypothetical protein